MANEKKIDCVILGLLNHEELTGYEIKKRMDTTLKYFWGASYGSIYPTLRDIVKRGLAVKREEIESGRAKLIYTITSEGKQYLMEWLKNPVEKDELRYETLLKLFFGDEAGTEQTLAHIEAFEKKIEGELPYLLAARHSLEQVKQDDRAHLYFLLTVNFGIKTYQGYLEWCKEAKEALRE